MLRVAQESGVEIWRMGWGEVGGGRIPYGQSKLGQAVYTKSHGMGQALAESETLKCVCSHRSIP